MDKHENLDTSKIKDLHPTLNSKEKIQKLYFNENFFSFFISSNFHFYFMNVLDYVNINQGIHKGKMNVARNEKRKKLHVFSFSINIANFEAFL